MKFSTLLVSLSLASAAELRGNLLGSAEAQDQHGAVQIPDQKMPAQHDADQIPDSKMYTPHAPNAKSALKGMPVLDVDPNFVNKDILALAEEKDTTSTTESSSTTVVKTTGSGKPNVILILVDDQGHGDIDLGSGAAEFDTPTLSALATEGVHLKNFYSASTCTPSRAMLMTGRYAIRYGFQDSVIHSTEPRGVPLTESFLSDKMKKVGYTTVMIGKW